MDSRRFDDLTQRLGTATSRRQVLKLLAGGVAGGLLSMTGLKPGSRESNRASAQGYGHVTFQRTWERTDKPVADGQANRTWMWGPQAFTGLVIEDYLESPGGKRDVQYFDKSRMEITDPSADANSIWYVTNGLLSTELATGRMQTGHNSFEQRAPAQVNVAGDADDPTGPTYASFSSLLDAPNCDEGELVLLRVNRSGDVTEDGSLASYGITTGNLDPVTDHCIATPFWEFMTSQGVVWENGDYVNGQLFENPYFATGRPITEAYWATVRVGGTNRDVLMQCFERRCLTYTPGNPNGWQTEAGNVGRHYWNWRYAETCPEGYQPIGGECVSGPFCPDGYELIDGECFPVNPCEEGFELVEGECLPEPECPVGYRLEDGWCTPEVPCQEEDYQFIDGECMFAPTCPEGYTMIDGLCKFPPTCPEGFQLSGGVCRENPCEEGFELVDGECVPEEPPCPEERVCFDGSCRPEDGECPEEPNPCPEGRLHCGGGNCCPSGFTQCCVNLAGEHAGCCVTGDFPCCPTATGAACATPTTCGTIQGLSDSLATLEGLDYTPAQF